MQYTTAKSRSLLDCDRILLTARLVDRAGAPLQPCNITTIEYSLLELDPFWPHQLTVVADHKCVPLDAGRVLLNELCRDESWVVDAVGYNFRHAPQFERLQPQIKPGRQYEARYDITLATGEVTVVRFHIRSVRSDRSLPALANSLV